MSFSEELHELGMELTLLDLEGKKDSRKAMRLRSERTKLWSFATDGDLLGHAIYMNRYVLSSPKPLCETLKNLKKVRARHRELLNKTGQLPTA